MAAEACWGRRDTGGGRGEPRYTQAFANMRLSPAGESQPHCSPSTSVPWRLLTEKDILQGLCPPPGTVVSSLHMVASLETTHVIEERVSQQTNHWAGGVRQLQPPLIFDVSPFVPIPDVTTWAGPSWNGPALCKDRNNPGQTWREEEKWKRLRRTDSENILRPF